MKIIRGGVEVAFLRDRGNSEGELGRQIPGLVYLPAVFERVGLVARGR